MTEHTSSLATRRGQIPPPSLKLRRTSRCTRYDSGRGARACRGVEESGRTLTLSSSTVGESLRAATCFHCGLPAAAGGRWRGSVLGQVREFCCAGCQAVARAISAGGLEDYYRLRTTSGPTAWARDEFQDRLLDREELQESFVRRVGRHREASLVLEGVRCPACLWLIERRLSAQPGVVEATAGYAGQSARLVFAGVLGMMVMNLAVAAYFLGGPDAAGRLPLWESFGRWCALFASAVLLAYPGQDFFAGAWRDLRRRRAGMDTPIVLGLCAAWAGSAWATVEGSGPVYFDAIAMLVFFVLLARAFETRARLAVAAVDLSDGDVVPVCPGEIVPADGVLMEGQSSFDEAVMTGEPWPRARAAGDAVVAGSCNRDQPVLLRVTRAGKASTLGQVRRLLERGLASRPPFAQLADRLAGRLVVVVLVLSAATAAYWAVRNPAAALPATIAVLLVTCPCALALATPIALSVAAGRFAAIGGLPARMEAVERLASSDTMVFDKTGTLTLSAPVLESVRTAGGFDSETALQIAAALEAASSHPIGRALRSAALALQSPEEGGAGGSAAATEARADHEGQGFTGTVSGVQWW